jgi:epoxyqueuosine reductase
MVMDRILEMLHQEKLPVYGIGPVSGFAAEPAGFRPSDYLPGVQSLVCFGAPIPQEVYRSPVHRTELIWRSQNLQYRRLDTIALRISALLTEEGSPALPVFGCMPLDVNARGKVVGYVNQVRMAEITGIGVIGKNGLLLHRQFGSRLMLGGLLTTAVLPALRFPEIEEPGCPPGCQVCSRICPVQAILPERKQVDIMRCLAYSAQTPLMSRLKFLWLRLWRKNAAGRYMSMTAFDELTFHICSRCVAMCPYGESG